MTGPGTARPTASSLVSSGGRISVLSPVEASGDAGQHVCFAAEVDDLDEAAERLLAVARLASSSSAVRRMRLIAVKTACVSANRRFV